MNFNEGFNPGANRPEASEAEIDFTEEEREESADPSEENELEKSIQEKADAILEEEDLEAAAEAAEDAARERRLKDAIEMERENFEQAAAVEEKRILDKLYTDTPEEKFAETGPQRDRVSWKEYYRSKNDKPNKEEGERKNKQKRKTKKLIVR